MAAKRHAGGVVAEAKLAERARRARAKTDLTNMFRLEITKFRFGKVLTEN
jgi:hypothetical protein